MEFHRVERIIVDWNTFNARDHLLTYGIKLFISGNDSSFKKVKYEELVLNFKYKLRELEALVQYVCFFVFVVSLNVKCPEELLRYRLHFVLYVYMQA